MLAIFEGIATVLATAVIAWFTVALASSTKRLWKETMKASTAALKTAQNMESAERAYVKMSHRSPGVHLEEGNNWFAVNVEVRNEGRTPARITDVVLTTRFRPYDEALPVKPEYIFTDREEGPVHAFLVTREHFMYERTFPMRGSDFADAKSGAKKLWMLGYVDYIDVFRQHHRAGYARVYNPIVDDGQQNTLHFVIQKDYNYDRERDRSEGDDWGEPSK